MCWTHQVVLSGLVPLVVQVAALFLQVELDPVVKTDYFCSRFCFTNKDVFEPTGVQTVAQTRLTSGFSQTKKQTYKTAFHTSV